nr:Chain A, VACUOLAR TARGETING PEPTIDE [Nicotiana alata]
SEYASKVDEYVGEVENDLQKSKVAVS